MQQPWEKKQEFLIKILYYVTVLALVYVVFRYAFLHLMPFVLAFAFGAMLQPLIRWLHRKAPVVPKGMLAVVVTLVFYAALIALVSFLGFRLGVWLKDWLLGLPDFYQNTLEPAFASINQWFQNFVAGIDPDMVASINALPTDWMQSLGTAITEFSVNMAGGLTHFVSSVPGLVADVVMMVIATFFVAMDYDRIVDFVARQLPEDKRRVMHHAWRNLKQTLGKYVKSYSLILLVTFVELSIGLSILGVENAVLIALLIAVFDILPVVGSAVITYPWAVIALIQGRIGFAIGMAVMATIIVVVRDVLEPQIVGQTVGMHPLLTLLSMVVGLRLFGGIGLLGLPVALVIIKNLNEQGIISLYRNPPKKEQPPRRPLWKGRRKSGAGDGEKGGE